VDEGLLEALLHDFDRASADTRLKPLLRHVRQLTLTPSRVTHADADMVFVAGWTDQALHDAVSVCALFNLMNHLVNGLGITVGADYQRLAAERLARHGYAVLLKELPES
jgi:uncharacterized protein YciW